MAAPDASHHHFINRALSFALWENLFKPIAPLLELVCAGLFVGGAWGKYKFYESLIYFLFRISLMGMDRGIIWYYSQVDEKAYLKAVFRSLNWCLLAFLVLAVFATGSHYGWLPFSSMLGKNEAAFSTTAPEFFLYLLSVPLMVIIELCVLANVNKRNLKYRILVQSLAVPLFTFGAALAGRLVAPHFFTLPFCLLLGNTVGAALAVFGFLRTHRPTWSDVSFGAPPALAMIRYSLPLAGANLFSAMAVRVDIFMLAGLSGVHGLEVYSVVSMVGKALTSIRQSFENIILSAFSSSGKGELTLKLKHYFNYAIWLVMNIQGALLALAVVFGAEMLGLVNPQYSSGGTVLAVTAFFIYINTASDFSALLSLGLGRTAIVPISQAVFFAVNLGLNILLIPRWDVLGAAVALGLANMTAGILYYGYLAIRNRSTLLLPEYWFSIFASILLWLLPSGVVLYWGGKYEFKILALLVSAILVFSIQRTWYKRFNRILHGLI